MRALLLAALVALPVHAEDGGTPDIPVVARLVLGQPAPSDGAFLNDPAARSAAQHIVDVERERDSRVAPVVVGVAVVLGLVVGGAAGWVVARSVK